MNGKIKFEKEITVMVDISFDELMEHLDNFGFVLNEEYDVKDIYMVKNDVDMNREPLHILKECVLIRNIITDSKNLKFITYKYKEYNDSGEIIKNGKVNCNIISLEEAKNLLKVLGYNELFTIDDHIMVYSNETTELNVQFVNNKHIYIEIEEDSEYVNTHYKSLEEMISDFKRYDIPIVNEDYFVKKAEIMFKEAYRNK